MAKVQIIDVIEPKVFAPYVSLRTLKRSALFQSGIAVRDPRVDALARQGGRTFNMPFWNPLTGNSEILSDTLALTPSKVGTGQDISVLNLRGKSWKVNDLAEVVAGDDPVAAIANGIADFWAADMQDTLNAMLTGVFTGPLASSHMKDISVTDAATATSANKISAQAMLAATFLLGDRQGELTGMITHSAILQEMINQSLIIYDADPETGVAVPSYLGRRVIVDDDALAIPTTNGFKFYTILFAAGSIRFGEGTPKKAFEADRDVLFGDDILVTRRHFILHPSGVAFTGTFAGATPTNAELANPSSWTKVYENKMIRMVALVTNG